MTLKGRRDAPGRVDERANRLRGLPKARSLPRRRRGVRVAAGLRDRDWEGGKGGAGGKGRCGRREARDGTHASQSTQPPAGGRWRDEHKFVQKGFRARRLRVGTASAGAEGPADSALFSCFWIHTWTLPVFRRRWGWEGRGRGAGLQEEAGWDRPVTLSTV